MAKYDNDVMPMRLAIPLVDDEVGDAVRKEDGSLSIGFQVTIIISITNQPASRTGGRPARPTEGQPPAHHPIAIIVAIVVAILLRRIGVIIITGAQTPLHP